MKILITGGASGIGEGITRAFAKLNPPHELFFTYNKSKINAEDICNTFSNTTALHLNFLNEKDIQGLCSLISENMFDVLINNALPSMNRNHFHKLPVESFTSGFENNLLPIIRITQQFILSARKRKFGKIITILSSAIHGEPPIGYSGYIAEKNYLSALHKSWAIENSAFNITSNCISPGFVLTDLNKNIDSRVIDEMISKHPLKQLLSVAEVASVVCFLLTVSQQLNGQDIVINSSQSIQ